MNVRWILAKQKIKRILYKIVPVMFIRYSDGVMIMTPKCAWYIGPNPPGEAK